jgi:nucleotide-binding universal stress UspA family protein
VRELNFLRRDIGQIIVASAVLEDTIGWIVIAVIFGIAGRASADLWSISGSIVGTVAFLALSLTVGRSIVAALMRWSNDLFVSEYAVVTTVIALTLAMALITHLIGVHTVLGAFVAGILIGESPILVRHVDEQLRGIVSALFMPIFFGVAGLGADLSILGNPQLLTMTLVLIVIASIGKFSGAFVGGKIGGLSTRESLALGCAMNARGSTEVIVATIGVSMGILSQNLFTMILVMAIVTTTVMPPTLRWALRRLPMRRSEQARLRREELDRRSFIANLERLLLAVDQSHNGRLASRLAGLLAGFMGKPVTILQRTKQGTAKRTSGHAGVQQPVKAEAIVERAADQASEAKPNPDAQDDKAAHITARHQTELAPAVIEDEARKGYDFLVVGIAAAKQDAVADLIAPFDGAVMIVAGAEKVRGCENRRPLRILVPTDGSETSRNAAEVAFVWAQSDQAEITVLHVLPSERTRNRSRGDRSGETELAEEMAQLAKRYGVKPAFLARSGKNPGEVIIREARDRDVVVLGVRRRDGSELNFGHTAAAVLDKSDRPTVLVADQQIA